MAITTAIQYGQFVRVYDENNHERWSITGDLQNYTGNTVTIRSGNMLYVYDENGREKFSITN